MGQQKLPPRHIIEALLRLPEVWQVDYSGVTTACNAARRVIEWIWPYPEARSERIAEARRLREKWRADAVAAREVVATLLNVEPREWRGYIAAHSEARTAAVVDVLLESAEAIKHLPIRMHELTSLAIEAAAQLDDNADHRVSLRHARGCAWRYHAVALEGLTRYRDALAACDAADGELEHVPAFADERATVAYVRGTVLTRMGELDAALPHIRFASRVYREYGDTAHFVKARVVEGYVLYSAQRNGEALQLWTALVHDAREIDDQETIASLYLNIGIELRNRGEFDRAIWHLRTALRMFAKLGMASEIPRARLTLVRVQVLRGEYAKALPDLWKVSAEFSDLGMRADAANVRLEIVEILLILERFDEAFDLCSELPDIYLKAGMTKNVLQACGYLHECARMRDLHVADVQHVRLFLQDLPQNPARPFLPLRRAGK